jgi:hypothetical protein
LDNARRLGQSLIPKRVTLNVRLKNVVLEGELDEQVVVREFRTTAAEGKS